MFKTHGHDIGRVSWSIPQLGPLILTKCPPSHHRAYNHRDRKLTTDSTNGNHSLRESHLQLTVHTVSHLAKITSTRRLLVVPAQSHIDLSDNNATISQRMLGHASFLSIAGSTRFGRGLALLRRYLSLRLWPGLHISVCGTVQPQIYTKI
jgi:hypothetical protein